MKISINRRQFVGAIGALLLACRRGTAEGEPMVPNQVSPILPQSAASRLVFCSSGLAWLREDHLALYATEGEAPTTLPVERPAGLGALSDGSLVVLDQPASAGGNTRLRRLRPGAAPEERQGNVNVGLGDLARVLPGVDPDGLWVAGVGAGGGLSRLTLRAAGFTVDDYTSLPDRRAEVLAPLDGGVLWLEGGSLVHRDARGGQRKLALPEDLSGLRALAGAGAGAVWAVSGVADLSRVAIGEKLAVQAPSPQPEAQVHHLASAGGRVALLLVEARPAPEAARWSLALYDAAGLRWKKAIDAPSRPDQAWVALSDDQVAVGGGDAPRRWSAASPG